MSPAELNEEIGETPDNLSLNLLQLSYFGFVLTVVRQAMLIERDSCNLGNNQVILDHKADNARRISFQDQRDEVKQ
jgi:hypothetical protein